MTKCILKSCSNIETLVFLVTDGYSVLYGVLTSEVRCVANPGH